MTNRQPPRLALAALERFVPDSEALAGDLAEEFERRQSAIWLWLQVLAAIRTLSSGRGGEIRPLRLVDLQPTDAVERSRRLSLRFAAVPLTSGLGLALFVGVVTIVMPAAWWALLASALAGVLLGVGFIALRGCQFRNSSTPNSQSTANDQLPKLSS